MVIANFNALLMVGHTGYSLTCNISGADRLNATTTYQWTRYQGGSTQSKAGTNEILNLTPLTMSSVGEYTCNVTIGSTLLSNNIQISAGNNQSIIIPGECKL